MSELRWNPLLGEWVVTATHRQERTYHPPADFCPLCPTRPGEFETEIPFPDFDIAVFENRFPTFCRDPGRPSVATSELFPVLPSGGICEVVVYSPRHDTSLAQEPEAQIYKLVQVWRDRFQELGSRPEIKYVYIFENKGEAIGVTLSHPHGQIYGFPYIPPIAAREIANMRKAWRTTGSCLLCSVLRRERRDGRRLVFENDGFTAVIPFYARYPYEVHIMSRRHLADLTALRPSEMQSFAQALKRVIAGYDVLFGFSFPYMMLLHQRPTDGGRYEHFHFHVEFLPPYRSATRLKYLAGCESGAGTFINDTLAEEKAPELRAAIERAAAGEMAPSSHAPGHAGAEGPNR
jgi:UDPglucose--hexose-1-phosphate uridylyltransferase